MAITAEQVPCVELGLPELFEREDFQTYLNDPDNKIATWHTRGEEPGDYSDVFVTFDNCEGSNSDMPGWDLVCAAMHKLGVVSSLVRIVCY